MSKLANGQSRSYLPDGRLVLPPPAIQSLDEAGFERSSPAEMAALGSLQNLEVGASERRICGDLGGGEKRKISIEGEHLPLSSAVGHHEAARVHAARLTTRPQQPSGKRQRIERHAKKGEVAAAASAGAIVPTPMQKNTDSPVAIPTPAIAAAQPRPTKKAVRKTAHSLIERRRRSKMNDAFASLRDMIPACRDTGEEGKSATSNGTLSREMHKLDVLNAAIQYLLRLEDRLARIGQEDEVGGKDLGNQRQEQQQREEDLRRNGRPPVEQRREVSTQTADTQCRCRCTCKQHNKTGDLKQRKQALKLETSKPRSTLMPQMPLSPPPSLGPKPQDYTTSSPSSTRQKRRIASKGSPSFGQPTTRPLPYMQVTATSDVAADNFCDDPAAKVAVTDNDPNNPDAVTALTAAALLMLTSTDRRHGHHYPHAHPKIATPLMQPNSLGGSTSCSNSSNSNLTSPTNTATPASYTAAPARAGLSVRDLLSEA